MQSWIVVLLPFAYQPPIDQTISLWPSFVQFKLTRRANSRKSLEKKCWRIDEGSLTGWKVFKTFLVYQYFVHKILINLLFPTYSNPLNWTWVKIKEKYLIFKNVYTIIIIWSSFFCCKADTEEIIRNRLFRSQKPKLWLFAQ